jgi:hypothetical protein
MDTTESSPLDPLSLFDPELTLVSVVPSNRRYGSNAEEQFPSERVRQNDTARAAFIAVASLSVFISSTLAHVSGRIVRAAKTLFSFARMLVAAARARRRPARLWVAEKSELSAFLTGVVTGAAILFLAVSPESGRGSVDATATTATAAASDPIQPAAAVAVPLTPQGINGEDERTAIITTPPASDVTERPATRRDERSRQAGVVGTSGTQYRGSLRVISQPAGAQVFLNQRFVGSTPLTLTNLDIGSRAVRVVRDGHVAWSRSVQIAANRLTSLTVTLSPTP